VEKKKDSKKMLAAENGLSIVKGDIHRIPKNLAL
jgi:hypothetical protein